MARVQAGPLPFETRILSDLSKPEQTFPLRGAASDSRDGAFNLYAPIFSLGVVP